MITETITRLENTVEWIEKEIYETESRIKRLNELLQLESSPFITHILKYELGERVWRLTNLRRYKKSYYDILKIAYDLENNLK